MGDKNDTGSRSAETISRRNLNVDSSPLQDKIETIQKSMYQWLKAANRGRITISKLYSKGKKLQEQLEEAYPEFWEHQNYADLKGAITFIGGLHDTDARSYHTENKEETYYHVRRLV